jgi:uncharacterized SAM-binding protein YcdF (DUF218 family)
LASQRPRHDCIIIFGAAVRVDGSPSGTLRRRVAAAMRFADAAGPVRFLVTGGLGRHPPAEAVAMRRLLLELGAREEQILVEDQARNTRESAILCARMLQGRDDVGAVIVCTSRYHIRRCRMLLRMCGIRTAGGAASEDAGFVGRGRHAYSWLREMVAIPVDAVRMTWHRLMDAKR